MRYFNNIDKYRINLIERRYRIYNKDNKSEANVKVNKD